MVRSVFTAGLVALFGVPAVGRVLVASNASAPITEVVSVDNVDVYSQANEHAGAGACQHFASSAVSNPAQPVVKVCGVSTQVTVYLRNRCEGYHEYSVKIGTCNSGAPSSSCVEESPATLQWMQTAQSYKIESC